MNTNQKWNDLNCYLNRGWICKIPKGVNPNEKPITINELFPGNKFSLKNFACFKYHESFIFDNSNGM